MGTTSMQGAATMAADQTAERPTRARFFILFFILLATIINYVDRTNLGIVAPAMSQDLGLDKAQMGQIFAAFGLTYAFALVPGGYIADLLGSRLSYAIALVSWSLATMAQGLAHSFNTLFGAELAIGLLESPAFPANARAVTMWFPTKERGLATSVYITGQYVGTPMFTGLLIWLASSFGWRRCSTSPEERASCSDCAGIHLPGPPQKQTRQCCRASLHRDRGRARQNQRAHGL